VDAEPVPSKDMAEPMVVQLPLPICTWKVAVPVGVAPSPETVVDNDTEVPTVVDPEGLKVGAGTVAGSSS
jgi:hypothetical protein